MGRSNRVGTPGSACDVDGIDVMDGSVKLDARTPLGAPRYRSSAKGNQAAAVFRVVVSLLGPDESSRTRSRHFLPNASESLKSI